MKAPLILAVNLAFVLGGAARAASPPGKDSLAARAAPHPTEPVILKAPDLAGWSPDPPMLAPAVPARPARGYTHLARTDDFAVAVFDTWDRPRRVIARTRRGTVMSAKKAPTSRGCRAYGRDGTWYEVDAGGFVCTSSGYTIAARVEALDQVAPERDEPLPFEYGRVITDGAPRLARRPTEAEAAHLSAGQLDALPEGLVVEEMHGDFFLAVVETEQIAGADFLRTSHNEWVRAADVKMRPTPPMIGEKLGDAHDLPLAFIAGEGKAPLLCRDEDEVERCGWADKHARFEPDGFTFVGGEEYVRGPDGVLVPRDRVRIARRQPRGDVPRDARWVHIDLDEQTLVAYEGDDPVYATLVSSGKPGRDTPTGLYRVKRKYLSKTMRGRDAVEGIYHVEEVPWTMYYRGAYAVHGAYWHNTFGHTRSHGCTNVAPADARWLYDFTSPSVKPAWHAALDDGTWFMFTQGG